jgi:ankyrin repeat protein
MFRKLKSKYLNHTKKLSKAVSEEKPLEVIKKLVEAKVDVNYPSERPPLYELIIGSRDLSILKYLLEKRADIHWKDSNGHDMLHFSVKYHLIGLSKVLLENNANPNSTDDSGNTSLHFAAKGWSHENDEKIVNLLIENHASTNITNHSRVSPWDIALCTCYFLKQNRSTLAIKFSLSEAGIKYREDMQKYNEELRVSELTSLTQQFFQEVLGFPKDIILNILLLYLLPQEPEHPMPEILMSDEDHQRYGETDLMVAAGNQDKESVGLLVEKKMDFPLGNNDNQKVANLELEKSRAHMHRFLTALSKKNSDTQKVVTGAQRRVLSNSFK